MRGDVIAYINWLLAKPSTELSNISDGHMIECPEGIFIERLRALRTPISMQFVSRSYWRMRLRS
jgi:hypothetical protein